MFDRLIGNAFVKDLLIRLIRSDRVPNSLLLAGIDGVGKKQFALQLAKAFLCSQPNNFEACDQCFSCKKAVRFSFPKPDDKEAHKRLVFSQHPDLAMVIPFNRNILVDAIRDLEREANFRPSQARKRFFIIDDADAMNESSTGALLKTLEEPPETSFIVLVTSRPDSLFETIRSRCLTIRLAPVAAAEVEEHLVSTRNLSRKDAGLLAKLARGSVGRAMETDPGKFREGRDLMLTVLESLLLRDNRAVLLRTAEEISDPGQKNEYEARLDILQTLIYDIWSLTLGKSAVDLVNSDIADEISKFAENAGRRKLAEWLQEIEALRENLKFNLNRKIATDALFMQMAGG